MLHPVLRNDQCSKLKDRWPALLRGHLLGAWAGLCMGGAGCWHPVRHGNKLGKLLSLSFLSLHQGTLSEGVTLGTQPFPETHHSDSKSLQVQPNQMEGWAGGARAQEAPSQLGWMGSARVGGHTGEATVQSATAMCRHLAGIVHVPHPNPHDSFEAGVMSTLIRVRKENPRVGVPPDQGRTARPVLRALLSEHAKTTGGPELAPWPEFPELAELGLAQVSQRRLKPGQDGDWLSQQLSEAAASWEHTVDPVWPGPPGSFAPPAWALGSQAQHDQTTAST